MKVSIRTKMVGLLTIVALIPMVTALVVLVLGWSHIRVKTVGESILSVATSEAKSLEMSLVKEVEKMQAIAAEEHVTIPFLEVARQGKTPEEIREIEQRWASLTPADEPLKTFLENPIGQHLKLMQKIDPRMVRIFITDRNGQTVASSVKTENYYQKDERWWVETFNKGAYRTYVTPVYKSANGTWVISICIPIVSKGEFIGVLKAVMDVNRWLGGATRQVGQFKAGVEILDREGVRIYGDPNDATMPILERGPSDSEAVLRPRWRISSEDQIQTFAPIAMPVRVGDLDVKMEPWTLMIHLPKAVVLGPVYQLAWWMLALGLALITAIYLLGLVQTEQGVVRRIRLLADASEMVAGGNLSHRVRLRNKPSPFGEDEMDDLGRLFNQMIDRLQHSYQELAEASQLKTNFIRIAGHELRTPLTYILLSAAKLRKDFADNPQVLQVIQTMTQKAQRLNEIIETMFRLMPEQRLGMELHVSSVDVPRLVKTVGDDVAPFLEQRKQRLLVEDPGTLPVILGDREKLRDVVENLVMNAIKFSPDGQDVTVRLGNEPGGGISIAVVDRGPGIPPEDRPRLFQPFFSGGDVMQHSTGNVGYQKRGIGLGLAVVKHFVELHGGIISVQSGEKGSTFVVALPMAPIREHFRD